MDEQDIFKGSSKYDVKKKWASEHTGWKTILSGLALIGAVGTLAFLRRGRLKHLSLNGKGRPTKPYRGNRAHKIVGASMKRGRGRGVVPTPMN